MRLIFLLTMSLLFLVETVIAQPVRWHVKSGETKWVSLSESRLVLDEVVLEDGAQIRLAEDVEHWQLFARSLVLGEGVVVHANGNVGKEGQWGLASQGQAAKCEDGKSGAPGKSGAKGHSAVAITWDVNVVSWGSLRINNSGGMGGTGGAGGNGQQAGDVDKCGQTRGGAGGAGGAGGEGGSGGNVRIRYHYLDAMNHEPLQNKMQIINRGGAGGKGGAGGAGGAGTEGRYINMRTLTGTKKWVGGGKTGRHGEQGEVGRDGADGLVIVEEHLAESVSHASPALSATKNDYGKAVKYELELLRRTQADQARRIQTLETRLMKLQEQILEIESLKK